MVKESQTKRFCSCIKKVRPTLKQRKESGAIAICVKSVLQKHGRTLKKFRCKGRKARVITQKQKEQQGGARRYVFLADTTRNYLHNPHLKASVKIRTPRGPLILKPGDKVKHVNYLISDNPEEIFTYIDATFKSDQRHENPSMIIKKLKFSDESGDQEFIGDDRFPELARTIRLVKMKNMHVSPVSESIPLSVSRSRSRSRSGRRNY
jgi:hypothetical protein